MQTDFHHAVTYVTARLAGFSHQEADIVAYAAQYVDDAVNDGTIRFDNDAMYTRICSAHKMVDPANLDDQRNHLVWLPFHFLPGNGGSDDRGEISDHFIDKIVCLPGNRSAVAQAMLEEALTVRNKPNALHRLGITLHVYADTWAHQGFAGVKHRINDVDQPHEMADEPFFGKGLADVLLTWFVDKAVPQLGHGQAKDFPDMPFLSWTYKNGRGQEIKRDNTAAFLEAADAMCRFMQRYRAVPETGLSAKDAQVIKHLLATVKSEKAAVRHDYWRMAIADGLFSFGSAKIAYDDSGDHSWKAKVLGTSDKCDEYPYQAAFLDSDWKLFHDALQQHRLTVLHDILPNYGICAA